MPRKTYNLTEKGLHSLRAALKKNKPWKHSTGPKTPWGKKMSSLNAFRHGARSRQIFRLPAVNFTAPSAALPDQTPDAARSSQ
jgi:DNA-binding PadR family transcriptional regulator